MPTDTRYVAVSTDRTDTQVYAGPCTPVLMSPPAGREWIEEYRARAAGYWIPDGFTPEVWAEGSGVAAEETPVAQNIHKALKAHLLRSTAILSETTPPIGPVPTTLLRHERALNLVFRVLLEIFDEPLPNNVIEGGNGDNSTTAVRDPGK